MATKKFQPAATPTNIALFAPNLIGYMRIVMAAAACILMPTHPLSTIAFYSVSCLLDAVDGWLARQLGQCSQFGAVLDMIIDRSTTSCLLIYLATQLPGKYLVWIQAVTAVDLMSHYMQMYATLASGGRSHKELTEGQYQPYLLRIYYKSKPILFMLCAMNELFFIIVYLAVHCQQSTNEGYFKLLVGLGHFVFPFCAIKHVMNVVQLYSASVNLLRLDALQRAESKKNSNDNKHD